MQSQQNQQNSIKHTQPNFTMKIMNAHPNAQKRMNMDFPSKNYTRYRSQSRTNPLLHKLQPDVGYPQELLECTKTERVFVKEEKNFLELNKKGLRNLFADRLPPKEVGIWRESYSIDPVRMFQIKKKQYEMKDRTKSTIQQKMQVQAEKGKEGKIQGVFIVNDKNQELKRKFQEESGVKHTQVYESENFRKGTQSTMQKYSRIVKKQAYISVFGPEKSSVSRKSTPIMYSRTYNEFRPSTQMTKTNLKHLKVDMNKSLQQQRNKFSSLIEKIDKRRQDLDPQNKCGVQSYVPPIDNTQQKNQIKKQMISWIRDVTTSYKNKSLQECHTVAKKMEQVQKIDENFYLNMMAHKNKRLNNRQTFVQSSSMICSRKDLSQVSERKILSRKNSQKMMQENLSISSKQDECDLKQSRQLLEGFENEIRCQKRSLYLLKKLGRSLVNALLHARFYGIESKINVYKAFWKHPSPYEKSGSYAFFKSIKKGNAEAMQKFLDLDQDFIYQKDHKGRNALIYAISNNHSDLAEIMLNYDIDLNMHCFNGKTALFYAITHNNVKIAKRLLQKGANPWSNKLCRYRAILNAMNNQQMKMLFKNARKISIAIKMKKKRGEKIELWNKVRLQINQFQLMQF